MSKQQILMLLGVWVIVFLFLGFPQEIDKILALLTGIVIVITSYLTRPNPPKNKSDIPFVEHKTDDIMKSANGTDNS